jgi:hypothetical protein
MGGHWLYEWSDETSQFDPEGHWVYGLECYERDYKLWVPNSIGEDDEDALADYIERASDPSYPESHNWAK